MKCFRQTARRNGITFSATLIEAPDTSLETVYMVTPKDMLQVHEAEFSTAALGQADRDGYLRTLIASIRDRRDAQASA